MKKYIIASVSFLLTAGWVNAGQVNHAATDNAVASAVIYSVSAKDTDSNYKRNGVAGPVVKIKHHHRKRHRRVHHK
jgi:hypothetical protein